LRYAAVVVAVALVGGCKSREVPFKPPPKDDAAVVAIDAPLEIDAAVAVERPVARKVVVGDEFSCALLADETVRCWGKNSEGQLGNGTTTDSGTPVKVHLRGVRELVAGPAHVCAMLDDASVTCWGRINFGHKDNLTRPTAAPGVSRAKRIFAVRSASCATNDTGALVCWGDIDPSGHLRLSAGTIERRAPSPAVGLDHVVALTANGALHEDGRVTFVGADGAPKATAIRDAVEIASSGDEVCALRKDGTVACVGPTTRCAADAPKPPPAPKKAPVKKTKKRPAKRTAKTASRTKAAAPKAPEPRPASSEMPFEVLRLPAAKHLAFDVGLCVVTMNGRLQCLDAADSCKLDSPWPNLTRVDRVAGHCARIRDGSVRCWAVDSRSRVVSAVAGVDKAALLAASSSHACAVIGDGQIVCWGSNRFGALGRGEADGTDHPEGRAVEFE
jgi:hypothetical protein